MAPGCAPGWEGRAVRVLRNFFCMTLGFLRLLKNLPRKSMLAQFLLECLKEGKKKNKKKQPAAISCLMDYSVLGRMCLSALSLWHKQTLMMNNASKLWAACFKKNRKIPNQTTPQEQPLRRPWGSTPCSGFAVGKQSHQ